MAQPIYKVFVMRPTQEWYQLTQEKQRVLLAKVDEARGKVGGKTLVFCNSGWCSDQWLAWGVEQFPDLEAVQKHAALLNELNWFRYGESVSMLGTEWQSS